MTRRRSKKSNWNKLGSLVATLAGLCLRTLPFAFVFVAIWFLSLGVRGMLYANPHFQVSRVTVFPSGILTSGEIQFLEEATQNRNLLEVGLKQISNQLRKNSRIRDAIVSRVFPNELNIVLEPRESFVQVQFKEGGPYFRVSEDQIVLGWTQIGDDALMTLEDYNASKKTYASGDMYQNKQFQAVSRLLDFVASDAWLSNERVKSVATDHLGNWTVTLADDISIILEPSLVLSDAKREVLRSLFKSRERENLLYVDTRYQDIIIRKK
jgi:cell division septal protein FtsQ